MPTRRQLLTMPMAGALLLPGLCARAAASAPMQTVDLTAWRLSVPADWTRTGGYTRPHSTIEGALWMKSPNGIRNVGLSSFDYSIAHLPARQRIEIWQSIKRRALAFEKGRDWHVMAERTHTEGAAIRSEVELFDKGHGLLRLSAILATDTDVVELTLDDGRCGDYSGCVALFRSIAESLHRR